MQTAATQAPTEPVPHSALLTDTSISGVLIQFFTTNRELVPTQLLRSHNPKRTVSGLPSAAIIDPTPEVAVGPFLEDLKAAGFVLTDGFAYERPAVGDSEKHRKLTFVMRFQFHPKHSHTFESPERQKWAENILTPLFVALTAGAYWEVAAFNNQMPTGSHALGIRCSSRFPTAQPDGSPFTRKPRDGKGKPCGEPQPFVHEPKAKLRIMNERLVLA